MDWIKNQLSLRPKKVGEALAMFGVVFIGLPVIIYGSLWLMGWVFGNYWRGLIVCAVGIGYWMMSMADHEVAPKGPPVYRVVHGPALTIAPAVVQKQPEPQSQQEQDKALQVARMQTDHWHRISMFLLGLVGILVTALGLLLRSNAASK